MLETFFLPDDGRPTVEVPLHLCDTTNSKALHWMKRIYTSDSSQVVFRIFEEFEQEFKIVRPSASDYKNIN